MPRFIALLCCTVCLLWACSPKFMVEATDQTIQAPPTSHAQVVFMLASKAASNAALYEVRANKLEFIGTLTANSKLVHITDPGQKTFMVFSEAADFMKAELAADKTYFSLATPRYGAWASRFSLWPMPRDPKAEYSSQSPRFKYWLKETKLIENHDNSKELAFNMAKKGYKRYNRDYTLWMQKNEADKFKRTLHIGDGYTYGEY